MGLSLEKIGQLSGGDVNMVNRASVSLRKIQAASQKAGADLTQGLLECGLVLDASISLEGAYYDGSVQEAGERALAWASTLDASGALQAGFFESKVHGPYVLKLGRHHGWVNANKPNFGGTNLFDAIVMGAKMAAKELKEKKILDLIAMGGLSGKFKTPLSDLRPVKTNRIYHLTIVTDGAPNTGPRPYRDMIKELIIRLSYCGIFIKFIYVGNDAAGRNFLQLLDDMPVAKHQDDLADEGSTDPRYDDVDWFPGARYIDNVDKVEFPRGLRHISDEDFADAMTQELNTYVPCAVRRGLVSMDNVVLL